MLKRKCIVEKLERIHILYF